MSRYLFVVPPLTGHINPAVAVAAELTARGHQVAWAGRPGILGRLAGPDAEVYECAGPDSLAERPPGLRGVAALKYLWESFFGPLAEVMVPDVTAAAEKFGPDVIVADQQAVAGAFVAERLGVPFVTSATTSAEFTGSTAGLPLVAAWISDLLTGLRQRFGDPAARYDPRFSPLLVLAFTTPELATGHEEGVAPIRFVGPALTDRPREPGFPWDWLDGGGDVVLVTLGTANAQSGQRFLTECLTAVRELPRPLRAVVVDPGGVLGPPVQDDRVLIRPHVPQLPLLARADAVVCHAGHNTVTEALWHGVPLVVAPIRDDQPVVAGQVTAAGAGLRVPFARAGHAAIGAALGAVLTEPGYAEAARRIAASFRAAGGAAAAADRVEAVTPGDGPHP
jgi:UDP:flavonoid glycosyltransferase YjiC (YdhE family)